MNGSNPTTSTGSTGWRACGKTHTVQCGAVMQIVDARRHTGECFLPIVLPRMAENLGVKTKNKHFFSDYWSSNPNESTKGFGCGGKTRADGNTGERHQSCLHLPSRPYEAVDAVRTSATRATVTEKTRQQHREGREVRIVCQQKERRRQSKGTNTEQK